jgi:NADPH-dependent 7-cyano-7-deazaguanine reductase QueF
MEKVTKQLTQAKIEKAKSKIKPLLKQFFNSRENADMIWKNHKTFSTIDMSVFEGQPDTFTVEVSYYPVQEVEESVDEMVKDVWNQNGRKITPHMIGEIKGDF